MGTMVLLGMAIKISSICLLGMASSEGITYFHKNNKLFKKRSKNNDKKSNIHDFRKERGEKEDGEGKSLYKRSRD